MEKNKAAHFFKNISYMKYKLISKNDSNMSPDRNFIQRLDMTKARFTSIIYSRCATYSVYDIDCLGCRTLQITCRILDKRILQGKTAKRRRQCMTK